MAEEKSVKITVEDDVCIGCGACVSAAPECFELNDQGKSKVKSECSEKCDCIDKAKKAADECPVDAIDIQ